MFYFNETVKISSLLRYQLISPISSTTKRIYFETLDVTLPPHPVKTSTLNISLHTGTESLDKYDEIRSCQCGMIRQPSSPEVIKPILKNNLLQSTDSS
ncbi:hypothetical protein TNCT_101101 [Trichonephila clavata]|uniref:Uncharacterized protein n=1 Tax=Trichonephila clavata TaxID=2740835 RepID=A0A8X6F678_TRICU|nr:hypothetical protein TNCT_101101 [Trichonephila clavata]